jgi:hypothetical protein
MPAVVSSWMKYSQIEKRNDAKPAMINGIFARNGRGMDGRGMDGIPVLRVSEHHWMQPP